MEPSEPTLWKKREHGNLSERSPGKPVKMDIDTEEMNGTGNFKIRLPRCVLQYLKHVSNLTVSQDF